MSYITINDFDYNELILKNFVLRVGVKMPLEYIKLYSKGINFI